MPNIEISIYDILGYLGERSRPLKEREEVFKAGHIILCGLDALDIKKITALCLPTSSLTSGPHKTTIELSDNTKDWKCICTCKAGMSGACKHIVAALIYVNRHTNQVWLLAGEAKDPNLMVPAAEFRKGASSIKYQIWKNPLTDPRKAVCSNNEVWTDLTMTNLSLLFVQLFKISVDFKLQNLKL